MGSLSICVFNQFLEWGKSCSNSHQIVEIEIQVTRGGKAWWIFKQKTGVESCIDRLPELVIEEEASTQASLQRLLSGSWAVPQMWPVGPHLQSAASGRPSAVAGLDRSQVSQVFQTWTRTARWVKSTLCQSNDSGIGGEHYPRGAKQVQPLVDFISISSSWIGLRLKLAMKGIVLVIIASILHYRQSNLLIDW